MSHLATLPVSRRMFLAQAAGGATALASGLAAQHTLSATQATPSQTAFFVVGDTHYLADKEQPGRMQERSAQLCGRLVDTLNRLPGMTIPTEAGGGNVGTVAGVIHVGDIIDTGDKQGGNHVKMQQTEFATFTDDFGLTGADGRLKLPVCEVHGNHDAPQGTGWAIEQIIARNKRRPGVRNVAANGVHYSWDWGPAHCINLGLIVGTNQSGRGQRRYAALDSLEFLIADLREHVGTSGRPVIITHHLDLARHVSPCTPQAAANGKEWDPCDVRGFYDALQGFKVAGIFYGHTHTRNVFQWDGLSPKATKGIHVFNNDNSSHFNSDAQAFLYVELHADHLLVREYQTKDGWQTGNFTPQSWIAKWSA